MGINENGRKNDNGKSSFLVVTVGIIVTVIFGIIVGLLMILFDPKRTLSLVGEELPANIKKIWSGLKVFEKIRWSADEKRFYSESEEKEDIKKYFGLGYTYDELHGAQLLNEIEIEFDWFSGKGFRSKEFEVYYKGYMMNQDVRGFLNTGNSDNDYEYIFKGIDEGLDFEKYAGINSSCSNWKDIYNEMKIETSYMEKMEILLQLSADRDEEGFWTNYGYEFSKEEMILLADYYIKGYDISYFIINAEYLDEVIHNLEELKEIKDIEYLYHRRIDYCNADLAIFRNIVVIRYNSCNWGIWATDIIDLSAISMHIEIEESLDNSYIIVLGKYTLKVSGDIYDLLHDHILSEHKEDRKENVDRINMVRSYMSEIYENKKINKYTYRFLEIIDERIFLSMHCLAQVEHTLLEQNKHSLSMSQVLITDNKIRAKHCKKIFEYEASEAEANKIYFIRDEQKLVNDFLENHFKLFKDKLIIPMIRHISSKSEESILLAYLIIVDSLVDYFGGKWEKEYENVLILECSTSLRDAMKAFYLEILIDSDDELVVGKFIYYLMKSGLFMDNKSYYRCYESFMKLKPEIKEALKAESLIRKLTGDQAVETQISIDDIDLMNGYDFEDFVGELFSKLGYKTTVTKSSEDQGTDVIAENEKIRIGVQAKCSSDKVTKKAVQEIIGALKFCSCDKGIVVTNSTYTKSARELADANDIILWDRIKLTEKIEENY